MSRDEIAKQLKGTRVDVETAAKAISEQFKQIRNGGTTTSVALHALRYEITILRHLCCALQENKHEYADIYCGIAANMLPHVAPCPTKPEFWTNHVISLHFIHHALCQEQSIKQCQKFYALICAQRCQLQSQAEYKPYLGIHIKHIYYFCQQMQLQATPEAQYELCQALQALGVLLQAMLQLKTERKDIIYNDFIVELNQLLGKRSSRFLKTIANLPVKYINKLCDPLFKLIACSESRTEHFPEYLSMLLALLQLDGFVYQQEQTNWSLQLLNSCRDLYKTQTLHKHPIQLLYYYIKLLFTKQSQQAYIDLAQKFVLYFEQKAGGAHGQEQWFMDFVLVLVRVQRQLHQIDCKMGIFNEFWTGLEGGESAAAYAAHFQLLHCLIGVATNLSSSSGTLASNCLNDLSCQSWRKHCIFTLGLCATAAYSNWQATGQAALPKSAQLFLIGIIRYAIDVAKVLKCMLPHSHEMSNFAWHLCNMADKATTTAQMSFLQQLLQPLQNLLPLLSVQDLRQLLRRLYKASSHCPETVPKLCAQLHSSYMASLANPYNQMCIYYRNTKLNLQTSIFESYMSSPLSIPGLEKRQLFELDMWAVLANRKTPELLQSLLRQRQTDYQAVLLGRHLRSNKVVTQQLEELRLKLQGKQTKLTRLQQLLLGHLSVTKLLETHEIQKIKIPVKETAEKCLEEMLIKRKALHLNISTEMPLVELATTAMAAFEVFFNRADAEPIGMDEALIDWEALIDDGIATAVMLATMGYTPQADSAWLLLLRITRFLGDRFNYLRALNYFLPLYTQHELLDLPQEVLHAEQLVDDLWPHLQSPHFFKRHQTIVLLSLCHLALYYGRLDRICHAQLLMLHVERLRDEFEERAGKCDIVQLTLLTVRFRLCYQQQHCRMLSRWPTALQQLDNLLLCVRQFVAISSVDQGALMLLLNDLVRDTTECTANRLSECPNFSSSLLQLLLQSGMMLRAVEVLISWLWTNLRMEYLDKAHSKLRLIEHFLCIKPLEAYRDPKSSPKSCHLTAAAGAAPMDDQTKHMSELVGKMIAMQLEHQVEPIRKQLTVGSSPRLERRPSGREHRLKLQRYVLLNVQDLHPVLRNNEQLQSIYFIVGCLHARLDFLNRDYDQLDKFYALANTWLKQDVKRSRGLGHLLLVLYMHEANFLRATSRKQQAIELLSRAATSIVAGKHLQQRVDVNYRYNLLVQLRSAQLELQPPVTSCSKLQNPRRALKFNTSPVTKPKRRVAKKPAAFTIYTEDSSFPSSSSSSSSDRGSSPERPSKSTKRLDMNACQLIEIIDLSDDEQPPAAAAQLKPTKSASMRTRARVQQTETPVAAVSVRRIATAPNPSAPPEETPKTTTGTRGRTRRGQSATEPPPPPAATPSVSTRSRQRN